MSPTLLNKHPLVVDMWWRPLVHIPSQYRGLLVQPGSTVVPTEIPIGWHWHWPGLSTVRLLSTQEHNYTIDANHKPHKNHLADEPIVAVTKDMQLMSIQAKAVLRIDHDANPNNLARLNSHTVNRFIRPTIRHIIRQQAANLAKSEFIISKKLDTQIKQQLQAEFAQQSLLLEQWQTTVILPFQTTIPSKSPAA